MVDEVFPLALANGEVGVVFLESMAKAGAVGRTPPKDGSFSRGGGFSNERLRDVFAVEMLGGLGSGNLVKRAVEIDGAEDGTVVGAAYFFYGYESGSPNDEGRANAAFIHPGLGSSERAGGSGTRFVAVVGANGDDGVVAEFEIVADAIEKAGELFVHGIENAIVECPFAAAPFVKWWPEWTVDIVRPEVDEEGLFLSLRFVDKIEGFVDEASGDFRSLHPDKPFTETFGIGPDSSRDGVAALRVGLHSERKKFGTNSLKIGE